MSPTQVKYPWRAVVRTVLAILVGAGIVVPIIWNTAQDTLGVYFSPQVNAALAWGVALIVAVSAFVTRIMAIPQVNAWLTKLKIGATPTLPDAESGGGGDVDFTLNDDDNVDDNAAPQP